MTTFLKLIILFKETCLSTWQELFIQHNGFIILYTNKLFQYVAF
jgi:hypothetical protein